MQFRYLFTLISLFLITICNAQETFPQNGVTNNKEKYYALTNATIYKDYRTKIENATLVIKNGKVINVGLQEAPKGAIIIDCKGKTIYPAFIDLISDYGLPKPTETKVNGNRDMQLLSNKKGAYGWNEAIKSEQDAVTHFSYDEKTAKELRENGFSVVLSHMRDGIFRGTGTLANTGSERDNWNIISEKSAQFFSFNKGTSTQNYPSSLMGAIALFRQTMYDAQWYKKSNKNEINISLQKINDNWNLPAIIETNEKFDIFRANKIAKEFSFPFIYKTSGNEYQRVNELKALNPNLIVTLNFPEAYDVSDIYKARNITLGELMAWNLAPSNLQKLQDNNLNFCITTADCKNKATWWKNLRKAIQRGLSEENALKALTYNPANFIKQYNTIGSLEPNKYANFIVCNGNVFSKDTRILETWVNGNRYDITYDTDLQFANKYKIEAGSRTFYAKVEQSPKLKFTFYANDTNKLESKVDINNHIVTIALALNKDAKQYIRLTGNTEKNKIIRGKGTDESGNWIDFEAIPTDNIGITIKSDKNEIKKDSEITDILYPFIAFGNVSTPKSESVLFKNATVWTNEKEGILRNTDVFINNGIIEKIGSNLVVNASKVIDATDKHITSGIIDEHSHIAITRGVNEGTQESSAEVSIGDVVTADDINIYRQLAGGVTISQLLHGSANPIGGQSEIIKLRWGKMPEDMRYENAPKFIKFALGENVKQSNWGDNNRIRYPQTRMGVEQVFYDYFSRAKQYAQSNKERKDLELETLQEILENKRYITCHSYVQSEINMLMKVADSMGFKVNTFTHILEGYKVADKIKIHGANASTFADWWDYKFEVYEAIPYNSALLTNVGVNTGVNSDDAEMARRLNHEAAKAVKYGNLTEEEAWKLITLNPAKMLHIDDKVGSIKIGKSADMVLWSDNPLSVYATALQTYVDGIKYFDTEDDIQKRETIKNLRNKLIQKMIQAVNEGESTGNKPQGNKHLYHCDDIEEE